MIKLLVPAVAIAAGFLAWSPARADFSACASAIQASDPQKKVELYTICLKRGGLMATDAAGALNNRGIAYEHLGQTDQALQDFVSATQYDPSWPDFRFNRASAEAQKGQCAQALADMKLALKMAPHRKQYIEANERLTASCPVASKPPS
jgi:tetratricopeptide (TPR) repeat protein